MNSEPRRVCVTHNLRASFWYVDKEWCWEGAEARVYGKWPLTARCEVVWEVPGVSPPNHSEEEDKRV